MLGKPRSQPQKKGEANERLRRAWEVELDTARYERRKQRQDSKKARKQEFVRASGPRRHMLMLRCNQQNRKTGIYSASPVMSTTRGAEGDPQPTEKDRRARERETKQGERYRAIL